MYLKYFDFKDKELVYIKIKDVFKPLSYKQKFESAVSEIKKAEEEREVELVASNKEKEKRIEELEESKEKIQTTLDLLEKSEFSKDEASKMAKIGYLEDDIETDTFIWSEYLYYIFGFDPKQSVPTRNEIAVLFDEESQIKMAEATFNLDTNGVPFDIELKMINLRNEEVWIRVVVEPIYNGQNKIIFRRGVIQDITDFKKSQFEIEHSRQKIQTTLELFEKSEQSYKEVVETTSDLITVVDDNGDITFVNHASVKFFGLTPKECIGRSAFDFIHCDDVENTIKAFEKWLNSKNDIISHENRQMSITGATLNVSWKMHFERENNQVVKITSIGRDITDKKIKQKTLDRQNEKLYKLNKALNEAQRLSHVGSWQWDMATDKAEWSDEMYNIYGVSKGSFYPSNENVLKTVLSEDLHKIEAGISSLLIDKVFVPFEFRIKRPSGEVRYLYIMALEKNSKESVFGVTKDITRRKKIEGEHLRIQEDYKKLFNNATVSIWNEDLSLVFKNIDKLRKLNIPNISNYLKEHPNVLFSFIEMIKVNKVNTATLKLFKANSSEEFLDKIQETFGDGADKVFGKLIASIWNNEKTFTSEVNYKTLKGEEFAAIVSIPIPQTKIEQKTVPVSIQSIQSLKDAESAKEESIINLKEAQEISHVGSWFINLSDQKSEWSDEMYHIWGFDKERPTPDFETITSRLHSDDLDLWYRVFNLVQNDGIPYDIEFRICLPNNHQKTIRAICKPKFGEDGEVIGLKGVNQDITSQKMASEKIIKADEMYRLLTDNSNDLICLLESDSTFKYISPSVKSLLGYEQSEFLGKKVFSVVHPDDIFPLRDAMHQKLFSSLSNKTYDFRIRHKEGYYIWLEFLSTPVFEDNKISYFVTSARDITQSVLAKQEIQEYQTSLQKMTVEMTLIEEKQKKQIASNIHDHLSQSLVISKMKINDLKKNSALKVIDEDLRFIENHISEALENSRKITYELSPPVLYQLGIIEALNWLFEDIEITHKIECKINSNVSKINLNDVKSILLYRCIQELVKNAIKYANASLLTLELDKNELGVNLLLTDNGDGFDTSVLNNYQNNFGSGFGLFAVQERIRNIQGEITITSKINLGTSVKIFIPLSKRISLK